MTVHSKKQLVPRTPHLQLACQLTGVCRGWIYYLRSVTTSPPFSPSRCCGSATFYFFIFLIIFFSTFTLLPRNNIEGTCASLQKLRSGIDASASQCAAPFIFNPTFSFFPLSSTARSGPAGGRDLAEMSASVDGGGGVRGGGEERGGRRLTPPPESQRRSGDDVTGSQSKVSPGGSRKKTRRCWRRFNVEQTWRSSMRTEGDNGGVPAEDIQV